MNHFRFLALLLWSVVLCSSAVGLAGAQPRGGVLRLTITNGTTGGPGSAERVALIQMASGMEALATRENVSGTVVLEGIEVEGQRPYLLQVTSGGVNYNEPVNFGRGYEAQAEVTVYDVARTWNDLEVTTARFLFRREHEKLRVDKLFVITNRTEPKKTFYDAEGTFRFHLPSELVELHTVSASFESGMPVQQAASPLADGTTYVTRTAFKPGTTDIAISYDVDYAEETHEFSEQAYYPLQEVMALVAPADIEVEAEGWNNLGPEPEGRFVVYQKADVAAGTPLALMLSGGSEHAADLVSSADEGGGGSGGGEGRQVVTLPDPTIPQKWIVVLLMGAALTWGLLIALNSGPGEDSRRATSEGDGASTRRALADLESRFSEGGISKKAYRKRKRHLQDQLERATRGEHP